MRDMISNLTSAISIFDIIDILVVAFIIYHVLGFIRENRAQQLVKGVLALLAVFVLSELLKLNVLNWILRNILTIGVLALVILFQPELRRGLERMGTGAFFSSRFRGDKDQAKAVVDALVKAVSSFSASRTGALIVIERAVSLGDIAENGVKLDAEITPEILGNIFYKGSPLHDGAALIRDNKLLAAGCVLPLTARMDLGTELGTRHRAAIGITENSDAVAITVSEENGVISVAKDGKLNRFLDEKGLEKYLLTLYMDEFNASVKENLKGGLSAFTGSSAEKKEGGSDNA